MWFFIRIIKGAEFDEYLALHLVKWKTLLWALGLMIAFILASDLLTYSLGKDIVPQFIIKAYSTCDYPDLLCLGIIFFGPLIEELFFRGFLFEGFRNSKLGNRGAALLTAAAWAGLHLQYDFYGVATIFVGGLILAWFRLKTGSLLSCILCHFLMNAWAMGETVLYFNGFTFFHLSKI